ncbi:MAG TPA: hypothetical protein VFG50_15815 [Rhodothermales bacterium]|nr:hypothetical protein [Rhodothermales bacterium]
MGLGAGSPYGFCSLISANFGRERILQASLHGNSGLLGGDSVGAFSIAIGRSRVNRWARIAATAGPALVFGTNYSSTRSHYTTLGVLANLQGSLTPIKELGVGLDLYANLNLEKSAVGAGITIVLEGNK